MTEARRDIARVLLLFLPADLGWLTTLSLVFGGCCRSNAWALERATSQNPHAGTLITFAQFILVALYGLCTHLVVPRDSAVTRVREAIQARGARGQVCVAVEGHVPLTVRERFVEDVVREVRSAMPGVSVARVMDVKADVVIVDGEQASASEHRDYTVCLVSGSLVRLHAGVKLMVDVTAPAHPVVLPRRAWPFSLRLKRRAIPLSRWAVQVALFLLTSLMNNAAFAYAVPMPVHIIFRSGGLVVNMLIGWLVGGRRYTVVQVASVVLVTLGVACTTLSAAHPASTARAGPATGSYAVGIALLTLALVLSGLMGLVQDRTYAQYGRGHWQEALFYLHFLALPGFAVVWRDLLAQMRAVRAAFYVPLLVNVMTQLVCVAGVNRLTSRVNSLTVTLVLVVRKAVSLGISVLLLESGSGAAAWLWGGAVLVLLGTVGYTVGGSGEKKIADTKKRV